MLGRIKNLTISWTPSLLKNLGFGLALTGAQDRINEEDFSAYNIAAMTIGTVAWIAGACLEYRNAPSSPSYQNSATTKIIQQTLSHSAGLALVNTIATAIKDQQFPSDNLNHINRAMFLTIPITLLNQSEQLGMLIPGVKWETLRFLMLSAGGYLSYSGTNNLIAGEKDILSIISLPLGLALLFAELAYSIKTKNEHPIGFFTTNRKMMKLYSGATSLFAIQDLISSISDKRTADITYDAFAILTNILIYAAFIQLHRLAKNEPQAELTARLISNTAPNQQSTIPSNQEPTDTATTRPPTIIDISEEKNDDDYKQLSSSRLSPM